MNIRGISVRVNHGIRNIRLDFVTDLELVLSAAGSLVSVYMKAICMHSLRSVQLLICFSLFILKKKMLLIFTCFVVHTATDNLGQ